MRFGTRVVAWIVFAGILIMTIGPISMRPVSGFPISLERFSAFLALGACFGFAYPERRAAVFMLLAIVIAAMELAQTIIPGRHGTVDAVLFKTAGEAIGLLLAIGGLRLSRMRYPLHRD